LDGLSAFEAIGGYFLVSVLTAPLLATVGPKTVSYTPFAVAFGLFILHCTRRVRGGWDVWACGTAPEAFIAILSSIFGLRGLVAGILGMVALLLSPLLAWSYDRTAGRSEPAAAN
jgi:hypothetical protein